MNEPRSIVMMIPKDLTHSPSTLEEIVYLRLQFDEVLVSHTSDGDMVIHASSGASGTGADVS